jgi:hypothetical protein
MASEVENEVHECECDICKAGLDSETIRLHRQMNLLLSQLNEPQRRWFAGFLSQKPDSPSDRQLARIMGLDEKTIRRGRRELDAELTDVPQDRQRREGGGRLPAEKKTRS